MKNSIPQPLLEALKNIRVPNDDSRKGQNGKLLIIGGSELFHAASKWSLDIASKFVDMVFYSSIPSNNQLVQEAKQAFWNGIVVPRSELESYAAEADCILIGPGMTRTPDTTAIVTHLIQTHPTKKMVIDAGALQMVDPALLNQFHIITPHHQELTLLQTKQAQQESAHSTAAHHSYTQVIKGPIDEISQNDRSLKISGGNAGMTKGGTGDVLAGLIAAFYCTTDAWTAAVAGSFFNKQAGDSLYEKVGPYFNSSDLVNEIPVVVWEALSKTQPAKNAD